MNDTIFEYPDSNSARGEFEFLNRKFANQRIAIIGLGGTGSYILDLVSKTPVKEIHLYDGDYFQLHNAFRAPGAIDGKMLNKTEGLTKVDYYYELYSKMHKGIKPHFEYISPSNIKDLISFNCVFITVDKNKVRSMIVENLLDMGVTFIDAGIGVNILDDHLLGTIRVTTGSKIKSGHLQNRIGSEEFDENDYSTNIQIAELNCMSAVLAVLKWKKIIEFYQDLKNENNTLYFINTNKIINEDFTT